MFWPPNKRNISYPLITVTFEVLSAVLLKIKVLWDMTSCRWISSSRRFGGFWLLHVRGEAVLLLDSCPEGEVTATLKRDVSILRKLK